MHRARRCNSLHTFNLLPACSLALCPTAGTASQPTTLMCLALWRGSHAASRSVGVVHAGQQGQRMEAATKVVTCVEMCHGVPVVCCAAPACPLVIVPRACLPPLPQLLLNPTGQDAASYHITRLPACASTTNRYCELHTTAATSMHSLSWSAWMARVVTESCRSWGFFVTSSPRNAVLQVHTVVPRGSG